jgi:hypothetical protein
MVSPGMGRFTLFGIDSGSLLFVIDIDTHYFIGMIAVKAHYQSISPPYWFVQIVRSIWDIRSVTGDYYRSLSDFLWSDLVDIMP